MNDPELAASALIGMTYAHEMEAEPGMAAARPHPRLRPFVEEYAGYRILDAEPGRHAGLPSRSITMIVSFDDPVDVAFDGEEAKRDRYWGMVGGLHRRPAWVQHPGRQHGIQLRVTPDGARALFGMPAGELGSTIVALDQVAPWADELIGRLSEARSWRTRFAVLDDVLLRELSQSDPLSPELRAAWDTMRAFNGQVPIDELADRIGWSRRHLSEQFRKSFGLTPKVMARVLRFERAQTLLKLPTAPSLSAVAASCGYADQAHMTREWREFAGSSPTTWLSGDLPNVQDEDPPDG